MQQNVPVDFKMTASEDALLNRTLERKPQIAVPEGFAARVAAALPPQSPRRAPRSFGSLISLGAAMVVTLVMFALAPAAHPVLTNFAFDMELLMLVQLCAIGWYYALRREM
ncbi:hypothetical protein [Bryocella elongata]|nr:hypothetical protein [Bryocella elongata]